MGLFRLVLATFAMVGFYSFSVSAQSNLPGTAHKRAYLAAGDLNGDSFDDVVAVTSHPDTQNNNFYTQLHWYLGNSSASRNFLDYQGVTGSSVMQKSTGRLFAKPVILAGQNGRGRVAIIVENVSLISAPPHSYFHTKSLEIYDCNTGCSQLTLSQSYPISIFGNPSGNSQDYRFLSIHLINSKKDFDQDGFEDLLIVWSEADPTGEAVSQWQQATSNGVGLMGVSRFSDQAGFPGPMFVTWPTNVSLPIGSQILDEAVGAGEVYGIGGPQAGVFELAIGTSSRSVLSPMPGFSIEHVSYSAVQGLVHEPRNRLLGFQNFIGLKTKAPERVLSIDFVDDLNTGFIIGGFIHPSFRSPLAQFSEAGQHFGIQLRPVSSSIFPYANVSGGVGGIYFEFGEKMFNEATGDFFGDSAEEAVFALRRHPRGSSLVRTGMGDTSTLVVAGIHLAQHTPYLLETYPRPIFHMVSGDFNGDGFDDLLGSTGEWFHKFSDRVIPGQFTLWLGNVNRQIGLTRVY